MVTIGGANWGVTQSDRPAPRASSLATLQWKRSFPPPEKPLWGRQLASEKEVKTSPANMELFTASTFGDVCWKVGCNSLTLYRECSSCGDSERSVGVWVAGWCVPSGEGVRVATEPLHQVTWPSAKDLFSCCWRTNSQISFYRANGFYSRPIGGASDRNVFTPSSNTNIIGWFYVSEALHAKNFGTRRRIRRHLKTDDNVDVLYSTFCDTSLSRRQFKEE